MNILFVCISPNDLLAALDYATALSTASIRLNILLVDKELLNTSDEFSIKQFRPSILIFDKYRIRLIKPEHIAGNRLDGAANSRGKSGTDFRSSIKHSFKRCLHISLIYALAKLSFRAYLSLKLLLRFNIDLVVMRSCNTGTYSVILNRMARFLGRKTMIITNMHTPDITAPLLVFSQNSENIMSSTFASWFHRKHPNWFRKHNISNICRLPIQYAFWEQMFGFSLHDPWVPNTCDVDAFLVESDFMKDKLLEESNCNFPIEVVGSLALDNMSEIADKRDLLRAKLFSTSNLKDNCPLILCALPPSYRFGKRNTPQFATYQEMLDYWFATISNYCNWNVAITPHPGLNISSYLINYDKLILTSNRAFQLIPLCDLYISTVSTTVKWAKACGIPSVSFDCFFAGSTDHETDQGHYYCDNRSAFAQIIGCVCSDDGLREDTLRARSVASRWGEIDGRACERIVEKTMTLIKKKDYKNEAV